MTAVNIRITDRIEGNTLENSTFKDYTVTHGGKEYKHNAKDDQSSMTETMVEIQIEENGEFFKCYMCECKESDFTRIYAFIDGVATFVMGGLIFRKLLINHMSKNEWSVEKALA